MTDTTRRYILNKKCFAATRALGKGRDGDKHWDYMYVSPKGVICTDRMALIQISLPPQPNPPTTPQVFTSDIFEPLRPKTNEELVTMPEGAEAKCDGNLQVPNFNAAIPKPETQIATITVTAKHLIDILKAACEVTDHARYLVRLRICGDGNKKQLRVDVHRDDGGQDMIGVVMGTVYTGENIPGDPAGSNPHPVEAYDEKKLTLPLTEGRKFRSS
jgi:hypothetical protein